ncbi:MAG: Rpn family recombination-promoting nuclease/putative transposase, partial [Bacteroidales bacterium]|nr:Rpn family recombination-promoting nuclease/putative transposase [Bacteroidales bacterium]
MARYLDPRNDLVFKRIFGENPDLAKSFLNALLPLPADRPIAELQYLTSEMVPLDSEIKRNSIVDVRCTDSHGRQFIVEMQMFWTSGFIQRMLFNAAKAYTRQDFESGEYAPLKPVYALALINDVFKHDRSDFYHLYELAEKNYPEDRLHEIAFVFVELPKFKPETLADRKMAVLWLRFLNETGRMDAAPAELEAVPEISMALQMSRESAFTQAELTAYEKTLDSIRVEKTLMSGKFAEGRAEG